ncbi:MAG: hypothetical protein PGN25_21620 [Methylorubrum populi]
MLEADHPLRVRIVRFEKISDYLLSRRTAKSLSRYTFFTAYGFDPDDPQRLVDAIDRHPETGLVTPLPSDIYGQRWNVVGPLITPDGRNPVIRTGWIKDTAGPARFVTAIPKAG